MKHAKAINDEPMRVAAAGESAGGNLATVVSMVARDQKMKVPVHQLLVPLVIGDAKNNASYQANPVEKRLNPPMIGWFFKHYDAEQSIGAGAEGRLTQGPVAGDGHCGRDRSFVD